MRTISVRVTSRRGPRRHVPSAVAEDRDRVGDERQFLEPVRDEQDRGSMLAQVARDAEKLLGLRWGQRRGRFIKDQEFWVSGQRTSNLDELKFSNRKLGDKRARIDRDAASCACATTALRSTTPRAIVGVAPMLMFSATSRCGNSFGS